MFENKPSQCRFVQTGVAAYFVGGLIGYAFKFMSRAARGKVVALKTDRAIRKSVNQRGSAHIIAPSTGRGKNVNVFPI